MQILNRREDIFIALLIVLVGFGSFGLGRLSKIEEGKEPVHVMTLSGENLIANSESTLREQSVATAEDASSPILNQNAGKFVASKNGGKYHHPWCPGAVRIKEENKIWFDSKEEAEKAGYTPATNCKGL